MHVSMVSDATPGPERADAAVMETRWLSVWINMWFVFQTNLSEFLQALLQESFMFKKNK